MNKFIIFDLDGTLIDTLTGITAASNALCKDLNLPYNYSKEEVKTFIGTGAKHLFLDVVNQREFKEEEFNLFLEEYEKYQYVSEPFPHVIETLLKFEKLGFKLFLLSNKPDHLLQKLIKAKLNMIDFKVIQGQDMNYPCKPDPTLLNEKIIKPFNLNPKDGWYVGDSYVDALTGKNSFLKTILLSYGYGNIEKSKESNPDYLIDEFSTLLGIIK